MLLEITLWCLVGVIVGSSSGITPGLHLNLVSIIAVSLLPTLGLHSLHIFIFVMSVAVTHTIVDVLASTYLGVPDEQTIAGLLPAQQMVLDGRAHESIFCTIVGSVLSVYVCVFFLCCLLFALPFLETFLAPFLGCLLLFVLCYLLWREKERLLCACLFLLAGTFGVLVLSQTSMSQPLLPLLGGLFGGAGLTETIRKNVTIPAQKEIDMVDTYCSFPFGAIVASALTGILAAFLPGLGSSQTAILAGRIVGNKPLSFQLVLAGGINTVNMVFSLATWLALGKSRNGAVAALSGIGEPTLVVGVLLVLLCCVVAPLAGIVVLLTSRRISCLFSKIDYRSLAFAILLFIVCLIFWFDGALGLVVFIGACCLGSFCQILGLPKHYLMGCLLLQVIVFFLQ